MHNNHIGITTMRKAENLEGIAPEQYGSRKSKAAHIQALNIRIFYDIIRKNIIPATSIFEDIWSKYDLVVHIIA